MSRFDRLRNIAFLVVNSLALVVAIFGFAGDVSAMNHGGMAHDQARDLGCQQSCNSISNTAESRPKSEIEQQRKCSPDTYPAQGASFTFNDVKRLTVSPSVDFRLLRPPDLQVVYEVFRI